MHVIYDHTTNLEEKKEIIKKEKQNIMLKMKNRIQLS